MQTPLRFASLILFLLVFGFGQLFAYVGAIGPTSTRSVVVSEGKDKRSKIKPGKKSPTLITDLGDGVNQPSTAPIKRSRKIFDDALGVEGAKTHMRTRLDPKRPFNGIMSRTIKIPPKPSKQPVEGFGMRTSGKRKLDIVKPRPGANKVFDKKNGVVVRTELSWHPLVNDAKYIDGGKVLVKHYEDPADEAEERALAQGEIQPVRRETEKSEKPLEEDDDIPDSFSEYSLPDVNTAMQTVE